MDKGRTFWVIVLIAMVIFFVGYFINEQSKKTTYEEVMGNLIGEDEIVEQIKVYSQIPLVTKTASVTINKQELIEKLLNQDFKLKEIDTRKLPAIDTTLVIKTNKDSYEVGFDEWSIMIGSERYLLYGDLEINPWGMTLIRESLDWEIIEYTNFPWK